MFGIWVTVNNIGPGAIYTPIDKDVESNSKLNDQILAEIPMGRWGKPEAVAQLAVYLASEDAAYVTGSTHFIDGGMLRHAGSSRPLPTVGSQHEAGLKSRSNASRGRRAASDSSVCYPTQARVSRSPCDSLRSTLVCGFALITAIPGIHLQFQAQSSLLLWGRLNAGIDPCETLSRFCGGWRTSWLCRTIAHEVDVSRLILRGIECQLMDISSSLASR